MLRNPGFERPVSPFGASPSKRPPRWLGALGESGSLMQAVYVSESGSDIALVEAWAHF